MRCSSICRNTTAAHYTVHSKSQTLDGLGIVPVWNVHRSVHELMLLHGSCTLYTVKDDHIELVQAGTASQCHIEFSGTLFRSQPMPSTVQLYTIQCTAKAIYSSAVHYTVHSQGHLQFSCTLYRVQPRPSRIQLYTIACTAPL